MNQSLKVAIIGLDSSHTIQFVKRMQAPDCPENMKVHGLKATSCLRFETPFQSKEGLDARQKQLQEWNVKVTTDFDEAVSDCDAIMIVINDPSLHLKYFEKCADFGKPIFMDKPLCSTLKEARVMADMIAEKNMRVFSCSSLRYVPDFEKAVAEVPKPAYVNICSPLAAAPSGSPMVWYGVHGFEMIQRAMGSGAKSVSVQRVKDSAVAVVDYADGRRAVLEFHDNIYWYGGRLVTKEKCVSFLVDPADFYTEQLRKISTFLRTGVSPVPFTATLEIMSMIEACRLSYEQGMKVKVESIEDHVRAENQASACAIAR